jgi:hypothetical protein
MTNLRLKGQATALFLVSMATISSKADQSKFSYFRHESPRAIAVREARRANISPQLVLDILEHESKTCTLPTTPRTDLGCMQISRVTARALKLDLSRLVHDNEYNIVQGVAILAYFKARYEAAEPRDWWSRYNVGAGPIKGKRGHLRALYAQKVGYVVPIPAKRRK